MRFGVCAPLDKIARLAEVGYDYIEPGVQTALIPAADEVAFETIRRGLEGAPLRPEAYAGFIPSHLRVVGEQVDMPRLSCYVATACRRAEALGGQIIVYGSSGSRNVAEGYSYIRAEGQIADFLTMAADHAEAHGITIVIEPLCQKESNILRNLVEGLAMAKRVNRKGIRLLVDLYHMWQEHEPLDHLLDAAEWLAHVHIAEPVKRSYPGNDRFDFSAFFRPLKQAGYDGRVSCECRFDEFDRDVETALRTLEVFR